MWAYAVKFMVSLLAILTYKNAITILNSKVCYFSVLQLGGHKRGKKKREEISGLLQKQRQQQKK